MVHRWRVSRIPNLESFLGAVVFIVESCCIMFIKFWIDEFTFGTTFIWSCTSWWWSLCCPCGGCSCGSTLSCVESLVWSVTKKTAESNLLLDIEQDRFSRLQHSFQNQAKSWQTKCPLHLQFYASLVDIFQMLMMFNNDNHNNKSTYLRKLWKKWIRWHILAYTPSLLLQSLHYLVMPLS